MRARVLFAVTALAVLVGLVVQVVVVVQATEVRWDSPVARAANLLSYFTIESNILVGVTTALLAANRWTRSTAFDALRLAGLFGITVTFVVYHVALAELQELEGGARFADSLLHTVVPVLCVAGWLVFGPRGRITGRVVAWSLLFPVLWLVFTLIRGEIDEFYPYPFVDVAARGYATVAVNCVIVAVVIVSVALLAWAIDRRLSKRPRAVPA